MQAAQAIVGAHRPLAMLRELAHDFPSVAVNLARLRVNRTLVAELERMSNTVVIDSHSPPLASS